ncbi:MAG: hypothetical protein ABNH29_16815 [Paracoccus sp. (in: a-proteobacteria)]|jgi:hypothetical protein|uniref:hypothetical protein n=1 Tax=Paracoccus sp. TaxID=267 RepID=UPI0032D929CF
MSTPNASQFIASIRNNRYCDLTQSEVAYLVERIQAGEIVAAGDGCCETSATMERIRAGVHSRIYDVAEANALGNIAHAEAYVPGYARHAERREAGE